MRRTRWRTKGGRVAALVALSAGVFVAVTGSSSADVTAVSGRAFGYYTNIGLFGGPPTVRGFGQTIPPGTALSASPSVVLPSTGGNVSQTDSDGATGTYGPANIFESPGPIVVSTQGTTGPGGSVTSSATVNGLPQAPSRRPHPAASPAPAPPPRRGSPARPPSPTASSSSTTPTTPCRVSRARRS